MPSELSETTYADFMHLRSKFRLVSRHTQPHVASRVA